jgi:hypothetical protein
LSKKNRPMPICTVNSKGRVVCPACKGEMPVPETHVLGRGNAICAFCKKDFFVDDEAVLAFHHFLAKQGSVQSKTLEKNFEPTPKKLTDALIEGGMIDPSKKRGTS